MKVVVLGDREGVAERLIRQGLVTHLGNSHTDIELSVLPPAHSSPGDVIEGAAGRDAVVLMRERVPLGEDVISDLPDLRLVITTGRNNAAVDAEALRRRGIRFLTTGGDDASAAELTWALVLSLTKRLGELTTHDALTGHQGRVGHLLEGRRLGIIGLGRVGSRVAKFGSAFGMEVVAFSRSLGPAEALLRGVRAVKLRELLQESDVVSVHLPLTPETRSLIGAEELGLMRPTNWLVNTSRSPIVDRSALLKALRTGAIQGAALDVHDVEPLHDDDPFLKLDNVVMTPHVGHQTHERLVTYYTRVAELLVAQARADETNPQF